MNPETPAWPERSARPAPAPAAGRTSQRTEIRDEQKGSAPLDGSLIQDPQTLSDMLMTEERAYMARWLALEVLMTDDIVCEDQYLFDRLSALQEKWKQEALARRGVIPAS